MESIGDGRHAYAQFADGAGIAHITCVARRRRARARQLLPEPLQGVDGPVQGRRLVLPAELPRLAAHDRARRRAAHIPSRDCGGAGRVGRHIKV